VLKVTKRRINDEGESVGIGLLQNGEGEQVGLELMRGELEGIKWGWMGKEWEGGDKKGWRGRGTKRG
jgi:hypothetical protein